MIEVVTFGCRLNALESELIRRRAGEAGLHDALIVNSCAVTAEAVRQARQAIRKGKREEPERPVIVTGCAAQVDTASFAAMPEVDRVIGNEEKLSKAAWRGAARVAVGDIMAAKRAIPVDVPAFGTRARAFLQVQTGCDHRCTFCIIPFGRGNSRSVPIGEVVASARTLVENGHAEIVLTGVDVTSYGADLPERPRLGTLVRAILTAIPELKRLRLSSIDSVEVDADLMEAIAGEARLMPHLHLSLQAGDDMILKRMKRRHLRADSIRFCAELRRLRPDIAFGADFIAGFPTETEAMFRNTLALVGECDISQLHVFPFSPRPGTPAARMPQLDGTLVRERAARLRAAGERALASRLGADVGRVRNVLVERNERGHTEHFLPTRIAGERVGTIVPARVTGHDGRSLLVEAA